MIPYTNALGERIIDEHKVTVGRETLVIQKFDRGGNDMTCRVRVIWATEFDNNIMGDRQAGRMYNRLIQNAWVHKFIRTVSKD